MPHPLRHRRLRVCPASRARWQPGTSGDSVQATMTAVWFEPTPFRNGALSHRLRPLGQTVLRVGALCFSHVATRTAELPGGRGLWQSIGEGNNCGARAHASSEWYLEPQAQPSAIRHRERCARSTNARGRRIPRFHNRKSELNQTLPDTLGRAVSGRFQHLLP